MVQRPSHQSNGSPPAGEELAREAERQLSERLRGTRRTLQERRSAADAAFLDPVPLFTSCIQWPGVMARLENLFVQRALELRKHQGVMADIEDDDADAADTKAMISLNENTAVESVDNGSFASSRDASLVRLRQHEGQFVLTSPSIAPLNRSLRSCGSFSSSPKRPLGTVSEVDFVETLWALSLDIMTNKNTSVAIGNAFDGGAPSSPPRRGCESDASQSPPASPSSTLGRSQSILFRHITPALERQHKTQFRKVFRHCDPRGTGGLTWEALTSFLLDSSMFMKYQRDTSLKQREWTHVPEPVVTPAHRPRQLKAMFGTSDMLIVDGSGAVYQFSSNNQICHQVEFRKPHGSTGGGGEGGGSAQQQQPQLLLIIDAEYIPPDHGVCFSTVGAELYFFDLMHKTLERVFLEDSAQLLQWHAPGKVLVTGDREGRITIWKIQKTNPAKRVKTPLPIRTLFVAKSSPIQAISCGKVKDVIVAGTESGVVRVFTSQGHTVRQITIHSNTLNCLSISEHQNVVACGTITFKPELWSLDGTGGHTPFLLEARVVPHASPVVSLACIAGTPQCVSMDYAGIAKVWHMQLLCCLQTFILHKHDPRSPWRGLVELNGFLFCTDRIEISVFSAVEDGDPLVLQDAKAVEATGRAIERVAAQCDPTSAIVFFEKSNSIVCASGTSLSYWDPSSQRITAEVVVNHNKESITCMVADDSGNRCFLGTDHGTVRIVNIATAGVLECFPHVHGRSPVSAVAYLPHAGVGISCSDDGLGMLLAPSSKVIASLLNQRGQIAFTDMDAGICVAVQDPWYVVVMADRKHQLHLFSTVDVPLTWKLHDLATCTIPNPLGTSRRKSTDDSFIPQGRKIVDVRYMSHTPRDSLFFVVADSFSISIVSVHNTITNAPLPPPFRGGSSLGMTVLAQWNLFSEFDGCVSSVLHHRLSIDERDTMLRQARGVDGDSELDSIEEEDRALNQRLIEGDDEEATVQKPPPSGESGPDGDLAAASPEIVGGCDNTALVAPPSRPPVALSDFQKDMQQLYASQFALEKIVADPQLVLLSEPLQHRMDVNGDAHDDFSHYFIVAFESGTIALFDASSSITACCEDDVIAPALNALRLCKLQTFITLLSPLSSSAVCVGRSDGLLDVVEVPSLGLMWSGLPAIAGNCDYFPPTAAVKLGEDGSRQSVQSLLSVQRHRLYKQATIINPFASTLLRQQSRIGSLYAMRGSISSSPTHSPSKAEPFAARLTGETTQPPLQRAISSISHVSEAEMSITNEPPEHLSFHLSQYHSRAASAAQARPSQQAEDPVWILGQLSTLCGDRSFLQHLGTSASANTKKETPIMVTPSGIPVFQGVDPFAECTPVEMDGGGQMQTNSQTRLNSAAMLNDNRKSQKQKEQERLTIKNPIVIKRFDELVVSRPSSSRSYVCETSQLPRHVPRPMSRGSLLRPLSSSVGAAALRTTTDVSTTAAHVVVATKSNQRNRSHSSNPTRTLTPVEIPSWLRK